MRKFYITIDYTLEADRDQSISDQEIEEEITKDARSLIESWSEDKLKGKAYDFSVDIENEGDIRSNRKRDIVFAIFGVLLFSYVFYNMLHNMWPNIKALFG